MIEYAETKLAIGNPTRIETEGEGRSEFMAALRTMNQAMAEAIVTDVSLIASLTHPSVVKFFDGTEAEVDSLRRELVSNGTLTPLNGKTYPNSYLYRSAPSDVARSEKDTYICTENSPGDVGPTNNWMNSREALGKLWKILKGSMNGRTMYIVPYWLGPLNSKHGSAGFEITDSGYVVANLNIITRTGVSAAETMAKSGRYVIGIHATASLDPENRYIAHFPQENQGNGLVISVNTNYGGNALLSKKCHALRISTILARRENWLAEHMMLTGIIRPGKDPFYVAGAFPSSSGKTNLSMIEPPPDLKSQGWKSQLISDDITWMHEEDGHLMGINPEYGFFGVVPHTSYETNPNAMKTFNRDTIFTNVAIDSDMNPFWEGLLPVPEKLTDWKGNPYKPGTDAAHPNSRFTTPMKNYPYLSPEYESPNGVPISAILYGGRRKDLIPLVCEAFTWEDGVLIGAMQRVETTAAAAGKVGVLRNDPMAMRPFLGYNMADYFKHHLEMGPRVRHKPKVYNVNWFRKDNDGKFMWPGYSNNMYVLKWIIDRNEVKETPAIETPIGYVPDPETFIRPKNVSLENIKLLTRVDPKGFLAELEEIEPFFKSFGERFPEALWERFVNLRQRLQTY